MNNILNLLEEIEPNTHISAESLPLSLKFAIFRRKSPLRDYMIQIPYVDSPTDIQDMLIQYFGKDFFKIIPDSKLHTTLNPKMRVITFTEAVNIYEKYYKELEEKKKLEDEEEEYEYI